MIVFVHGVPETSYVWDPLRAELGRSDVVAVDLPGFGCPRPDGFGATKEEYVDWLVAELERVVAAEGPVDLVGHDWGGGLVIRLVSLRPDLVRCWVTDTAGSADPDFEWHDMAKVWQTPGEGEAFWEEQLALSAEEQAKVFELIGSVPHDLAADLAGRVDRTMIGCILDLYRSATTIGREWGPAFVDIPAPGLVLYGTNDPLLSEASHRAAAKRAGAHRLGLTGCGHWWMLEDPALGARTLADLLGLARLRSAPGPSLR